MIIRLLHWLVRLLYRFRGFNTDALKTQGPVLLIPNHVSWLDWLFVGVLLDRDWRFVVSSVAAEYSWVHRKLLRNSRTFPIDPASPYGVKRMAEFLEKGGRLVLFAEGRISHTGSLMKLYDGTGFLLHKTHAKVITCHLRNAQRLPWVRQDGWTRWFPKITAHFSAAQTPPELHGMSTAQARARMSTWLRDAMTRQQFEVEMDHGPANVLDAVWETAVQQPRRVVLEDARRKPLTYRNLMIGVDLMASAWGSLLLPVVGSSGRRVGVLLPNINATPVVVLSLWAVGRVPAVLNFSTGPTTMLACTQLAGLKQIITSREFLQKAKLDVQRLSEAGVEFLYLEDVRARFVAGDKLVAALRQRFVRPAPAPVSADDTAVVLFTSGSEGVPKGVELTHRNLLANIRQMLAVIDVTDHDRMFNALPMFHSFGLTVGTLLPLVRGLYTFVYPSPLHYRLVPVAVYDTNATIMLGTNTFLNGYARKAHPYDFRFIRFLFSAAEKLQEATATIWAQRFGVRVLEGYGATECSPALSVAIPMNPCHGTTGRFLPGVEYRLDPVEGVAEGGRLHVRGPNIMRGYLNPDANAAFQAQGGWYDTGDIVSVDAEGFVRILGRLKRFAKVSGEMVSLTAVEDALAGAFPHYGLRCQIAVVTRPDADKGEALIAVSNEPKLGLDEIRAALKAKGFSNLCVPREIRAVREIPKLGTGKVDHRSLAKLLAE
jgi:acyl-[acyl-carrier-protein]-phospholipid O-acyltransferase/long-chain-fatty-acid--[acyl-carrier-protein] ligase